jgi:hypothetical protein
MLITFEDGSSVRVNPAQHIARPVDGEIEHDRAWVFATAGATIIHPETKQPVKIKSIS